MKRARVSKPHLPDFHISAEQGGRTGFMPTTLAHSIDEIEAILRRGLTPITDNLEALRALSFHRAYPQIEGGYDSTIWERSVDSGRSPGERRALARQRAYLER
jgi:hypothetical protein